uniref:Uncharacterized protein n=2 Tax=Knipowitschia caucasica TaxID=637954 RepID=A0AAV2J118_KNICA
MRVEGIDMHTSAVDRKCQQLEVDISDLRKEQMSLNVLLEQSERSSKELRTMMEVTQRGRKCDEVTDRQKLQTKLNQVNSILRTEQASREEKPFWMEQRISELEKEVVRRQSSEQECLSRLNFTNTELEKYKIKYSEERHKRLWL